jgi:polyphosphate kinase
MTRNTRRRIEIASPILDPALSDRLYRLLEISLEDNTQSWEQYSDGSYVSRYVPGSDSSVNSQESLIAEAQDNAFEPGNTMDVSGEDGGHGLFGRVIQTIKRGK